MQPAAYPRILTTDASRLLLLRNDKFQGKLISKYVSVLDQIRGIRAIQYLRLIVCRACLCSSAGRMRAVAANSDPVIFPRIVQGATFTLGLFRMRFALPMSCRVIT